MFKVFFVLAISFYSNSLIALEDYNPKLAKKLVESQGALLLDVRSDGEFSRGSIKGAKHIHYKDITQKKEKILKWANGDFEKPVVVFCAVGGRASKAKKMLMDLGFKNVSNMGGLKDWPRN